jgi:hypothetical protein
MHSSMIGKIQKAHLYAQEPDRVEVMEFAASFRGDHDSYTVSFRTGHWTCTCGFFHEWGVCSHIMATQRMMGPIAPNDQTEASAPQVATA